MNDISASASWRFHASANASSILTRRASDDAGVAPAAAAVSGAAAIATVRNERRDGDRRVRIGLLPRLVHPYDGASEAG
jgi:hypothetical protein